jgi:hypothetical protein
MHRLGFGVSYLRAPFIGGAAKQSYLPVLRRL